MLSSSSCLLLFVLSMYDTAQNRPGTYRRLEESREMQTMAVGDEAKPEQQVQQPPPYLGYAQPVPAVGMQQASNNVSSVHARIALFRPPTWC